MKSSKVSVLVVRFLFGPINCTFYVKIMVTVKIIGQWVFDESLLQHPFCLSLLCVAVSSLTVLLQTISAGATVAMFDLSVGPM